MDKDVQRRLIAKFGTNIDLENPDLIGRLMAEINRDPVFDEKNYDKTYTEGYNKEGYDKANYSKYDKTAHEFERSIKEVISPELDRYIVDSLREKFRPADG